MLEEFDHSRLIIENEVAMYPLDSIGNSNKKVYFAYMPEDFARELKPTTKEINYYAIKSRLTPKVWKPPVDIPISPVRIRTWFQNFAIEHGLKTEAVRFIVGHSPITVGEAHYYNLRKLARDEYRKLIDSFPI